MMDMPRIFPIVLNFQVGLVHQTLLQAELLGHHHPTMSRTLQVSDSEWAAPIAMPRPNSTRLLSVARLTCIPSAGHVAGTRCRVCLVDVEDHHYSIGALIAHGL